MTMLDQLLQILSPQKDYDKSRRNPSTSSSEHKFGKSKKKGKKNDKKPVIEEKKPYLEAEVCQQPSVAIDLSKIIHKPADVDTKEWVATHTISLFHNANLLYGTVSEFCTAESCPIMQGPCQMQYTWVEERGKKLKCTAPQYIDYVMTYCQKCVTNQELFPTKYAQTFSDNFHTEIKKMLRFLFHVISHMYYAHFARVRQLDLHRYLNMVFRHFTYFVREFSLLDRRETFSLDDLVDMLGMYSGTPGSTATGAETVSTPQNLMASSTRSASPSVPQTGTSHFQAQQQLMHSTRGNGATSVSLFQGWTST
ncbi:unnamed protein product [Clavelina lepadiformis]|uniref:MOB kinase activator 2 n=1 Tax=Clavelina lepadiformis TaxID=159417 RepID=A0ABP0G576_CLALP